MTSSRLRVIARVFGKKLAGKKSGKNQCDCLGQKATVNARFGQKIFQNLFDRYYVRVLVDGVAFSGVTNQYTKTNTAAACADFTTSSNFRSAVTGALSLAETAGTDSRKLNSRLLLTA